MLKRRCLNLVLYCCISSIFLLYSHNLVAQSYPTDRNRIPYLNFSEAQRLFHSLKERKQEDSLRLQAYLKKHGLRKKWTGRDKSLVEFQRIDLQGNPVYFIQTNERSAKTISADKLKPGGEYRSNLTGKGIEIGVWDGGIIFDEHDFFQNRVKNEDRGDISAHTTHVSGTLAGDSNNDIYDGLALEARLKGYIWDDVENEILEAAEEGMLLSNHSWTVLSGWNYDATRLKWVWGGEIDQTEDYKFGYYSQFAQSLDAVAHTAPYHLMVRSAGNDRAEEGPAPGESYYINDELYTEPRESDGGTDGYDCIPSIGISKNILTVGAIFDIPNGYKQASDAIMTDFSAWGPTDDGRIKPDVVASGSSVFSSYYNRSQPGKTNLVASLTGTSMSTPAVTGSLALLQEHYEQLSKGSYLTAASLKALIIHTADEVGPAEGPDYQFGWGLVNALSAVQTLDEVSEGVKSRLFESQLANKDSFQLSFYAPGGSNLHATLCWTDLPGVPISGTSNLLNNRKAMLVHDLDLRLVHLESGESYFPYTLNPDDPSAPPLKKDNQVDNVERIFIPDPSPGIYELRIYHKGSLVESHQDFSVFLSGIDRLPLNESDKEALITINESTGGSDWDQTWDLEGDPYDWYGVRIDPFGRVTGLDLSANNLTGEFPSVVLPLLDSLNVKGNSLIAFEASQLASQLQLLDISQNALTFADLLPLNEVNIPQYIYAPQDSLEWGDDIQARFGDSVVFNISVDSQISQLNYLWYKNDSLLEISSSNQLEFSYLQYEDSGVYRVVLSHPDFQDFTLFSKQIKLSVAPPICDLVYESQVKPATCESANGSISLDLRGGRLPYSLLWNTESTQSILENLAPGNYQLFWTDRNLCKDTLRFEINSIPIPEIDIEQISSSICGNSNGSASINVEGNTGPFSILWSNGNKDLRVDSLAPGPYIVSVSDTNQCVLTDTIVIPDIRGPQIEPITLVEAHCGKAEGEIEIEISGDSPPFQVLWENGVTGKRLENLIPGFYHLSVVDSIGCIDSMAIELKGSDTLAVDTVIVSDARCGEVDGQAEIRVQGGEQPYIFSWNEEEGRPEGLLDMLEPGPYRVKVRGQSGCEDSASFSILRLGDKPKAQFSFSKLELTYFFQNNSEFGEDYFWDFGDGNSSTELNPQHTYVEEDNYIVSLYVSNSLCGTDSISQFLLSSTFTTHLTELSSGNLRVYPSPARDRLYVDLPETLHGNHLEIRLIDLLGHTISRSEILPGDKYFISIPVNNIASGIYTVLVQLDSQIVSRSVKIGY